MEPPGISKAMFSIDKSKKYDVCTVGAGLSGAIFAERFANVLGKSALVLDSRHHIGGNCYDFVDQSTGILMNKYGAHLFRTNDERSWRYLTMHPRAPKWVRWQHEVRGWINNRLLPIPVNTYTVNALFNLSIQTEEEMDEWLAKVQIPCPKTGCETAEQLIKSRVGADLYKAIFYDYTVKQWNKEPGQLKPAAAARIPVYTSFDPRYFTAKYQVLPSEGYTAWFAALLDNSLIDVVLKTDFFEHRSHLEKACKLIVYTGPIDSYFSDAGLDRLEYRSIEFVEKRYFHVGYMQAAAVINYPSKDVKFTRAVEYKHFLNQEKSEHSIVVSERSTDIGDPYYPVPSTRNLDLYAKYKKLAEEAEAKGSVIFVGRLANYKYFSMDEAIVNALQLFGKAAEKLGMANKLGDFTKWMKEEPKAPKKKALPAAKVEPTKVEPPKPPPPQPKPPVPNECPVSTWRSVLERPDRLVHWLVGRTSGECFGLRPNSAHFTAPRLQVFKDEQKLSEARIAIILRGHFRNTDANSQAVDNLHNLLKTFPRSKVFIQTWTVRQTSYSWRQGQIRKDGNLVTKKLVLDYYRIPRRNFGGFVLDSEDVIMPKLKALYSPEELNGMVCSGITNRPSWAPNIGWLQMWWGVVQASAMAVANNSQFDASLNLRHDGYERFADAIPSWTTMRDLIVKYLQNAGSAASEVSCWVHLPQPARTGVDTGWVMSAGANYRMSAKWLYEYRALQEVICPANKFINQEELVVISALLIL